MQSSCENNSTRGEEEDVNMNTNTLRDNINNNMINTDKID